MSRKEKKNSIFKSVLQSSADSCFNAEISIILICNTEIEMGFSSFPSYLAEVFCVLSDFFSRINRKNKTKQKKPQKNPKKKNNQHNISTKRIRKKRAKILDFNFRHKTLKKVRQDLFFL